MSGGGYDPEARRDTPLALKLMERIAAQGSLPLYDYVHACMFDAEFGYYRRQPAIGASGDFVTAPEISQTFGELIGLWAAAVWQSMGSPRSFHLIEYGAGRGTLMRDALRAAAVLPGFLQAARISLCDINPALREMQRATLRAEVALLGEEKLRFVEGFDEEEAFAAVKAGAPAIIIGNEFLDVWPVAQCERRADGWTSRGVGVDALGRLSICPVELTRLRAGAGGFGDAELDRRFGAAQAGEIVTVTHYGFADEVLGPWQRFAALFIDYGHDEALVGDTLQAVRNHRFEHPLTSPGEADLSHQVDFADFAARVRGHRSDAAIDGPVTQAEFLGRLGIIERASRLMSANPAKAGEIEAGVIRLMAPQGMGTRFKAIGIRSSDVPALPGFE